MLPQHEPLNQCRPLRVVGAGAAVFRFWSRRVLQMGVGRMGLLINILITFLVIVLILYLLDRLPIDGRAKQIVRVVVIIIGILYLLRYLMTAGPII
jgi:uncharacterized membrane protein